LILSKEGTSQLSHAKREELGFCHWYFFKTVVVVVAAAAADVKPLLL